MKIKAHIILFLLISVNVFSQTEYKTTRFLGLTSLSGEVNIMGQYRQQDRILKNDISESLESSIFSGGLMLKSTAYVWHPNFLILGLDANYNPQTKQENYLVIPDRSEARSLQRLYITGTLLKQKPVSLSGFVNLNKNYINNENLTNIRSNDKKYGGTLYLRNKYVPVTISYSKGDWDQKELISSRTFKNERTSIQGRIIKSFSSRDNHKLSIDYNDYFRQYNNLSSIKNQTQEISLNNNVFLDRNRKYYFSSLISSYDQKGNNDYQRFQARENLAFDLPKSLRLNNNYFFNDIVQELNSSTQHRIKSTLSHELFLSLRTSVYFEYSNLNHTAYKEVNDKEGINIRYTKKIPKGQLSLSYHYFRYNQNMDSDPKELQILMEEHALLDDQIVLLDKEYVNAESVVVKDETGTIIYQENLDYILIERNSLLEIQRIPGGQITNGQNVYVDYISTQNDSFKYITNNNTFNASLSFFNRLIEVYYRISKQDFSHIEKSDYLTLNYYVQNVYGVRFYYKIISGGVEYDDYNSELIPYKMFRYYLIVNGKFRKNLLYTLNANFRDYKLINDNVNQEFVDISARIAYNFSRKSKINIESSYRNQTGREIDLDLLTLRTEYTYALRQMYFTAGAEMYNRNYLNEKVNFWGGYAKIVRKF